jgi:hypothetical protein
MVISVPKVITDVADPTEVVTADIDGDGTSMYFY